MSSSLLRNSARPSPYICPRCVLQPPKAISKESRRWIGLKYLAKVAEAELAWQSKATEIKKGAKPSMLSILEERGYVHTISGYAVSSLSDVSLLMDYHQQTRSIRQSFDRQACGCLHWNRPNSIFIARWTFTTTDVLILDVYTWISYCHITWWRDGQNRRSNRTNGDTKDGA